MRYSSFCDWLDETCKSIKNGTQESIDIRSKDVCDQFFENPKMVKFRKTLQESKFRPTSLSFHNATIGRSGSIFLKKILRKNRSCISLLLVDASVEENDCFWRELADGLAANTSLQVLHIKYNRLEASSFSLGRFLTCNNHLTELRYCNNLIDLSGAASLGKGLKDNLTLRTLDLTSNQMTDSHLVEICQGLEHHSSVESLILDFNNFGSAGVEALSTMLQNNTILTYLSLFGNHINEEGGKSLARALHANKALNTLILSFNDLGDVGAKHLADALAVNSTLRKLNMPANHLGNDGVKAFADQLPRMKGLQQLNIGDFFDESAAWEILDSLRLYNMELQILYMESMFFDNEYLEKKIDFYVRLNRGGRKLFHNPQFPAGLWSRVLGKAADNEKSIDVLYYLIREKPELIEGR